jgi:hypothetical protein
VLTLCATLLAVLFLFNAPVRSAAVQSAPITQDDIRRAMEEVKKDPNLATERNMRTLRWVETDKPKPRGKMGWMRWLGELFGWFASNGRFLFWGVLAVLAAFLLIYLSRLVGSWRTSGGSQRIDVPSFVRDLDIRPESLPPDIGSAARNLWDTGEHRAALALLYRGLLSRLVHVHGVPIKDSTTEGDCIALASRHLAADDRKLFVTNLVRLWQRAVYGGETVPTESVHALCNEFARMLDGPEASAAAPGNGHRGPAGASA